MLIVQCKQMISTELEAILIDSFLLIVSLTMVGLFFLFFLNITMMNESLSILTCDELFDLELPSAGVDSQLTKVLVLMPTRITCFD
jgi:maltodextrin utilization protein YvdJ